MAQALGPNLIAKIAQDPNLRHKLGDEQFMMKLKLLQSNPQQMMSTMFQDPDMCVFGVCHILLVSRRGDGVARERFVCGDAIVATSARLRGGARPRRRPLAPFAPGGAAARGWRWRRRRCRAWAARRVAAPTRQLA